MKYTTLIKASKRAAISVMKTLSRHAPDILTAAGLVAGATSTILACRATTHVAEVQSDYHQAKETIETITAPAYTPAYTDEERAKDLMYIKGVRIGKFIRLYAPAIGMAVLSAASILTSHHMMKSRNAVLAATLTATIKTFSDYRQRVADRFGDEVEKEIRHGVVGVVENEDGSTTTIEEITTKMYIYDFRPRETLEDGTVVGSREFNNVNPDANEFYLSMVESMADRRLLNSKSSHGVYHLYLNEVFDLLDMPHTPEGAVVGWTLRDDDKSGDRHVNLRATKMPNGWWTIDPNVDGAIVDLV